MKGVEVNLSGEDVELLPDNVGIALFRNTPELDYLDYHVPAEEDGEVGERHIIVFRHRELLIWMGGICLTEQDRHVLHTAERKLGSFALLSEGWRPQIFIEDEASEWEKDMYIKSLMPKDEDWHIDLDHALAEEFEESEDDGA